MSLVLDLIVVTLLVLGVILGVKRGFVRTIIEVVGCLLILFVATTAAEPVSTLIYEKSARPAIENAVVSGIGDDDTSDPDTTVDKTFNALPGVATNLLNTFGVTPASVKKTLGDTSQQTAQTIAKQVGEMAARPLIALIRVVFVVLLFAIGMVLIGLLAGVANKLAKHIPVVGTLNSWLGGVAGLLKGLAVAFVVANLLMLLLSLSSNGILGVTVQDAERSMLFSRFCWVLKA